MIELQGLLNHDKRKEEARKKYEDDEDDDNQDRGHHTHPKMFAGWWNTTLFAMMPILLLLAVIFLRGSGVMSGPIPISHISHYNHTERADPVPASNYKDSGGADPVPTGAESAQYMHIDLEFPGAPTIVFTVGIEGTGHHFISALTPDSPNFAKETRLGLEQIMKKAQSQMLGIIGNCDHLYENRRLYQEPFNVSGNRFLEKKIRKPTATLHQGIVASLAQVASIAQQHQNDTSALPTYLPFNSRKSHPHDDQHQQSYPDGKNCKRNAYPDLDLFFLMCHEAKVNAGIIYLYRDLYSVIKSTTRRHYHKNVGVAIRLYTKMLKKIEYQFKRGSMGKTPRMLACAGLFDESQPDAERWDRLGKIMGYEDPDKFRAFIATHARTPKPVPHNNNNSKMTGPAMERLMEQDRLVLELCKKQLRPIALL